MPSLPDNSSWFYVFGNWFVDLVPHIVSFAKSVFSLLIGLSFPLALFFFFGIIYCVEKLKKIRNAESDIYEKKTEPAFETVETGDTMMAHRWQNAQDHINSDNPNDWKQAIIEADIMLGDLLTKLGYRGETIGEQLKRVATGDMKSYEDAWEAHKVRNQIAHEGSAFAINHHEAKNIIAKYRKVFEEFYYI